ncbi:MAG TPA: GNAT family N-acetyltransferase [Candidatus Obscuribacterales bacterium]
MPSSPYFLCSERLGFRWWSREDLPLAKQLWGDPEVTRLFSKTALSDFEIQERLNAEIDRGNTHGVQYWPMFELVTDLHIGCCGLRPYRLADKVYELGFHLRPVFWGRGLASEAGRTMLDYAITEVGAHAIFAGHHPENVASRNVLLKLGFEETGAEFYEPTGLFHPSYMFYIKPEARNSN